MNEKKEIEPLDRNFVRKLLEFTQMNFPTNDQVALLHGCLARRLIEFDGLRGTYRVADVKGKTVRVKSDYFENREGVTFNDNGFVGFCGWADDGNAAPVFWAVVDWVKEITGYDATHKTLEDFKSVSSKESQ